MANGSVRTRPTSLAPQRPPEPRQQIWATLVLARGRNHSRSRGTFGVGLRLRDNAKLDEEHHAGDEADDRANGSDVEECSHGNAAIAIWPREADHQHGEPKPSSEHSQNAGEETNEKSHEREKPSQTTKMVSGKVAVPARRPVKKRFDVRIAVGSPDGPRSSVWHFWSRKSEVYAQHGG